MIYRLFRFGHEKLEVVELRRFYLSNSLDGGGLKSTEPSRLLTDG